MKYERHLRKIMVIKCARRQS